MKYAINYNPNSSFKYLDEVDEIIISFDKKDLTLESFLNKHIHQTVILSLDMDLAQEDIDLIKALYKKFSNIKLKFSMWNFLAVESFIEAEIPYFFKEQIDTLDRLYNVLSHYKPSDIYITKEMGFVLKRIRKLTEGIQIRVYPNIAQSSTNNILDIYKFFIRPEDEDIYSNYVDVYEFIGTKDRNNVYYEIYVKDKEWFGDLNEIIIDFNSSLDNATILPSFALYRLDCGKQCILENKCYICKSIQQLADTLKEKQYVLVKEE